MALIIKKDNSVRKWFDIPGGGGAQVLLRMEGESEAALGTEALYTKVYAGASVSEDIEKLYLNAIEDWRGGVEDESGKALKCTVTNKRLFIRQDGIIHFLRESLAEMREGLEQERKAAEKN
ncbi:hypothetical protein LJC59_01020 [Desulfovibrio sp. OttesenSCG-928-A18]|nr:hypothetical protein [Desulfovibrio sp. OttesenSCG-928-A18]